MKLFNKIKSWLGIKPKEEELVEETRIISDTNSEVTSITVGVHHTKMILSYLINDAIKNNRIKEYKNLIKFTEKYPCNYIPELNLDSLKFTIDDEVIKLCKNMMMLGYKTEDKYMKAMIRWGEYFFKGHDEVEYVTSKN